MIYVKFVNSNIENKIDIRNIGIHIPIILMLVLSIGHTSLFSALLYWVSTTVTYVT